MEVLRVTACDRITHYMAIFFILAETLAMDKSTGCERLKRQSKYEESKPLDIQ